MSKQYNLLLLLIFATLVSCEPEINDFTPDAGNADFSVFVALGGSETAGFANNELYKSTQIVSFPNIISRQLLHIGGEEFIQPLMRDELGFGNRLVLDLLADCLQDSIIWAVPASGLPDEDNMMNIFEEEGAFHNLGVPFARISHLTMPLNETEGYFYQYFARFASSPDTSPLSDALALQPTFFSLWTGLSDILDFAASGGTDFPITDPEEFNTQLTSILQQLTATAKGGVIGNLPDVLQFPYFTYIPAAGLWAVDSMSENGIRMLQENELVLLPAALEIRCQQLGSEQNPLPENLYLNAAQVELINNRIDAFNMIIREKADTYNLALADINTLIQATASGLVFDGVHFNNEYLSGGVFSVDGISLSRRGNAIIANTFINAINKNYNSTIPRVSVTQFQSIEYP